MYGLKRLEKDEVVELIKAGVPQKTLIKIYNLPQTTISTWTQELRKAGVQIAKIQDKPKEEEDNDKRTFAKKIAKTINESEARIMTEVGKYVCDEISDTEWFDLQQLISQELQMIASKFSSN